MVSRYLTKPIHRWQSSRPKHRHQLNTNKAFESTVLDVTVSTPVHRLRRRVRAFFTAVSYTSLGTNKASSLGFRVVRVTRSQMDATLGRTMLMTDAISSIQGLDL